MARPKSGPAFTFIAVLLRPLLVVLCKRDWRGREHVPQDGGLIVVANHYSFFDPLSTGHFLLAAGHRTPRFLAKAGVFKQPTLGKLFKAAGQIPVYRDSRDAALAFRDAVAAVERGEAIVVYPEGTMTKDPDLWPMAGKTGAARIALRTGAPVLPIAQWGAQDVFASYSKKPNFFPRKTLKATAGEPMDLRALVGPAATKEALQRGTDLIMDRITELLAEIRGEQPPAVRFVPEAKAVVGEAAADAEGAAAVTDGTAEAGASEAAADSGSAEAAAAEAGVSEATVSEAAADLGSAEAASAEAASIEPTPASAGAVAEPVPAEAAPVEPAAAAAGPSAESAPAESAAASATATAEPAAAEVPAAAPAPATPEPVSDLAPAPVPEAETETQPEPAAEAEAGRS